MRANAARTGLISRRVELPALGEDDHVVSGDLLPAQAVADLEQEPHGHGDTGQGVAQRDLPHLDATPDLDFLSRRQQRDLADLLQVQADGILSLCRARGEGLLGDGRSDLRVILAEG